MDTQPDSLVDGNSSGSSDLWKSYVTNASFDIHLTNALMPWTITSNVPLRTIPFMDTGTPGHCGSHLSATELITASGNLFWASESNSKTYSEKQSGSSGDEIYVSSESRKVIEFVMHEPMTNDERTKKRAGTSKTNQKKPSKGHSDKHWEMLRDNHLRRLYIQESHTVDEMVFEMLVIHGHRLTYVILCAYTLLSSKTRSIAD
ncbi:hypothetical protein CCHR01_19466 [Colletotrichum chrysophilum]|uniref:Uncharacterized protein n=1 Tax=Colletotrichum chrysophilum TaxID=1836956 RepID=A0AAD8ZY80_9PEZI|nr:hypothetical protein CCHR01_19466 [Colletotrichum chrysophilum]